MVTLEKEEIQQAVNKANLDADKEYQSKIASLSLFILILEDNLTLLKWKIEQKITETNLS